MFAQRVPPSFQLVVPFLVAAAALQVMNVQHVAMTIGNLAPLSAIVSNLG